MYTLKRSSLPLMILCFSFWLVATAQSASAQAGQPAQHAKQSNSPESTTCPASQLFTFGSGANFFRVCITDHGNITHLISPAGKDQIGLNEGYVACATGAANANDAGGAGENGWGDATVTQPGGAKTFPLTIKRQSTDGKLELTQTFNWDTSRKDILITMVLKNISAASLTNVKLARYFDGDLDLPLANPNNSEGLDDIYDLDSDSVWGRDSGTGAGHHGVMLTALTFAVAHTTIVQTYAEFSNDEQSCVPSPAATAPTAPGDYTGRVTYNLGTLTAGQSKTVEFLYRRF